MLENLRLAFPEKSEAERRDIARRTYRNLGQMIPDFFRVPSLRPEELERIFLYDGWDRFEAARARGKGIIAATAHFGNFEVLAAAHTLRGVPITMISRADGQVAARTTSGARPASAPASRTSSSPRATRSRPRSARSRRAGCSATSSTRTSPAAAPSSPPSSASRPRPRRPRRCSRCAPGRRSSSPLSVPLGDGRHKVVIEGPIVPPDTGDRDADALAFMQDLNDRLER